MIEGLTYEHAQIVVDTLERISASARGAKVAEPAMRDVPSPGGSTPPGARVRGPVATLDPTRRVSTPHRAPGSPSNPPAADAAPVAPPDAPDGHSGTECAAEPAQDAGPVGARDDWYRLVRVGGTLLSERAETWLTQNGPKDLMLNVRSVTKAQASEAGYFVHRHGDWKPLTEDQLPQEVRDAYAAAFEACAEPEPAPVPTPSAPEEPEPTELAVDEPETREVLPAEPQPQPARAKGTVPPPRPDESKRAKLPKAGDTYEGVVIRDVKDHSDGRLLIMTNGDRVKVDLQGVEKARVGGAPLPDVSDIQTAAAIEASSSTAVDPPVGGNPVDLCDIVPLEIMKTRMTRDLVTWLRDTCGITTKEGIFEACVKLKAKGALAFEASKDDEAVRRRLNSTFAVIGM